MRRLLALLLLVSCQYPGGAYFVHPGGNDSWPGTLDQPWLTLAKANERAYQPGERVYLARGGVWHEQLVASSSGAPGLPIEYGAYGPGPNPVIDGDGVREDLVYSNGKSWLIFRHLETVDSKTSGEGWGLRVQGGSDVLVEDIVVRDGRRHAAGAVETTRATFRRVTAYPLQPGQGAGQATSFVSFSWDAPSDTLWEDCTAFTGSGDYPAFIEHGPAVRSVVVRRLASTEPWSGIVLYQDSPLTRARVEGGSIAGLLHATGVGAVVDGLALTGPLAFMLLDGSGHRVSNVASTGVEPNWQGGWDAPIIVQATGVRVLDTTITLGVNTVSWSKYAIALKPGSAGAVLAGNTLGGTLWAHHPDAVDLTSDRNVLCAGTAAEVGGWPWASMTYTLAQWQALGFDAHSTTATCP